MASQSPTLQLIGSCRQMVVSQGSQQINHKSLQPVTERDITTATCLKSRDRGRIIRSDLRSVQSESDAGSGEKL